MMNFFEVFKKTLKYKEARLAGIGIVVGILAAMISPVFVKDKTATSLLLVGICLITFMMIERFNGYFRAIRVKDLQDHGKKIYKEDEKKKRN